jgi:hypothetical protein
MEETWRKSVVVACNGVVDPRKIVDVGMTLFV